MSLGMAIFRIRLCVPAQTFVKKATIYKNDLTPFVLVFSTWTKCEDGKKCEMKKYLLISMTFVTVLY